MKNFILLILVIFTGQITFAQLYAENSSFIFSKGTDIFVRENVILEAGTFFYLRGEAQLTQGNTPPGEDPSNLDPRYVNRGAGILSIYQEGTTNEYTYNYWSSPVSKQDTGSDGNVGFRRTQLMFPITGG